MVEKIVSFLGTSVFCVIVGAISAVVGFALGYWQGKIAKQTLDLSINKATPRLGSRVILSGPEIVKDIFLRYTMHTTLYNDGDLVASKVKGQWKLVTFGAVHPAEKEIAIDSLPSSLPWDFDHELSGDLNRIQTDPAIRIEVHIDLVYLGMNNKEQTYKTKYRYSPQEKAMIQSSDNDQNS